MMILESGLLFWGTLYRPSAIFLIIWQWVIFWSAGHQVYSRSTYCVHLTPKCPFLTVFCLYGTCINQQFQQIS